MSTGNRRAGPRGARKDVRRSVASRLRGGGPGSRRGDQSVKLRPDRPFPALDELTSENSRFRAPQSRCEQLARTDASAARFAVGQRAPRRRAARVRDLKLREVPGAVQIRPVESLAPGVVQRHPVIEPLHSGIKIIDALAPCLS